MGSGARFFLVMYEIMNRLLIRSWKLAYSSKFFFCKLLCPVPCTILTVMLLLFSVLSKLILHGEVTALIIFINYANAK